MGLGDMGIGLVARALAPATWAMTDLRHPTLPYYAYVRDFGGIRGWDIEEYVAPATPGTNFPYGWLVESD